MQQLKANCPNESTEISHCFSCGALFPGSEQKLPVQLSNGRVICDICAEWMDKRGRLRLGPMPGMHGDVYLLPSGELVDLSGRAYTGIYAFIGRF